MFNKTSTLGFCATLPELEHVLRTDEIHVVYQSPVIPPRLHVARQPRTYRWDRLVVEGQITRQRVSQNLFALDAVPPRRCFAPSRARHVPSCSRAHARGRSWVINFRLKAARQANFTWQVLSKECHNGAPAHNVRSGSVRRSLVRTLRGSFTHMERGSHRARRPFPWLILV